MNTKRVTKRLYVSPKFESIEVEEISLICTSPHVTPSAPGFNEDEWDNEKDLDYGVWR